MLSRSASSTAALGEDDVATATLNVGTSDVDMCVVASEELPHVGPGFGRAELEIRTSPCSTHRTQRLQATDVEPLAHG